MNPLELTGRTILVTGASSGIGRDTAVLLSQLGARLILGGRNEERLRETLRLLSGEGHRCESFDLSHCEDIPAWLRKSVEVSGPLQGLVHCAGLFALRPLRVLSARTVDEMLQVNVGAAIQLARALSQKGMSVPGASLVFVASVAGLKGQAGLAAYAASKGAIIALTRALAIELAGQRIRVNCVAPGMVRTQLAEELFAALSQEQAAELEREHPLGFGMPRDVSHAIAFLLAETSRWMTGSVLVVDGGFAA